MTGKVVQANISYGNSDGYRILSAYDVQPRKEDLTAIVTMKVEKIIKWPKNMAHLPYVNIAYDINKKYGGLSMPEIIQKISLDNSIWFIRPNSLPVINKKSNYSDYPFFKLTIYPGLDYFEPEPIERLPEVRKELNKNRSIFNIILGD